VGAVDQTPVASAGSLVPSDLDDRVVGIDADTLRKISRRIGIAGSESRQTAIHAAVKGGSANVLVTDTGTAAALLHPTRLEASVRPDEVDLRG
jgi:DNA-binding transcriptional regulator LsrR (DeoR family)